LCNNITMQHYRNFMSVPRSKDPSMLWKIFTTILFYFISLVIMGLTILIPSIDTKSEVFRRLYYRGDLVYNTTYLPVGNLVYYVLMNLMAHLYVNVSNKNCFNKHLLKDNRNSSYSFVKTFLFAPILFFTSSIICLRSTD
jgi:hypothetical protein